MTGRRSQQTAMVEELINWMGIVNDLPLRVYKLQPKTLEAVCKQNIKHRLLS